MSAVVHARLGNGPIGTTDSPGVFSAPFPASPPPKDRAIGFALCMPGDSALTNAPGTREPLPPGESSEPSPLERLAAGQPASPAAPHPLPAQAPAPTVPDWAQPGSATHKQVPPPADFHRPGRNFDTPIGLFGGQADIGSALIPGSASYDAGTKQYTISSAGYNIWYQRDEFQYLWKKLSGDVSLGSWKRL